MAGVCKPVIAGIGFAIICFATTSYAISDNVKKLSYSYNQNNLYHPSYDIAVKMMEKMFEGTQYDKKSSVHINPLIGMAEADLNGDNIPDIIAFPIESDGDNPGVLCSGEKYLCPFYVIDTGGDAPKVLGIIFADSVDMGDDIKNGHWTLKAFRKEREDSNDFEIYAYDPKTKKYEEQKTAALEPK